MGKSLHTTHINFFASRMNDHDLVVSWAAIPDADEYLFRVKRKLNGSVSSVVVHLTDAYRYGLADFHSRHKRIKRGSFVVLAMPHAAVNLETVDLARDHGVGVGFVKKFMGALNYREIWKYEGPEERRERDEQEAR